MIDDLRSGSFLEKNFKFRSIENRESKIHDPEHVDSLVRGHRYFLRT
jgi:hypothetical protein